MKCEICHKNDAETVVKRGEEGEDELYVCKACAANERKARQKRIARTRKLTGLPPGVEMSITEFHAPCDDDSEATDESGDPAEMGADGAPPAIFSHLMSAFHDLVSDISNDLERVAKEKKVESDAAAGTSSADARPVAPDHVLRIGAIPTEFRYHGRLHLEGLSLIGEMEAVKRAAAALDLDLRGLDLDGVHDAGHAYDLRYGGGKTNLLIAQRFLAMLVTQEKQARLRLRREFVRGFSDAICRSLAILKNCRLLSPGELVDLLSPIRLALGFGLLEGFGLRDLRGLLKELPAANSEDGLTEEERDRQDAERADAINARFEDVVMTEEGEGLGRG